MFGREFDGKAVLQTNLVRSRFRSAVDVVVTGNCEPVRRRHEGLSRVSAEVWDFAGGAGSGGNVIPASKRGRLAGQSCIVVHVMSHGVSANPAMTVSLEQFVRQLTDSGTLAGETIKNFIPPHAAPEDAEDLVRDLIRQEKLTKFQAAEVATGNGKSLVLGNYVLLDQVGAGGLGLRL